MEEKSNTRGKFSNLGFVLAAAGSAIGLGNLWKFPYLVGMNGGSAFIIIYLILIVLIGFPVMLGEMTIGRYTKRNPIGAYNKISPKWRFVGVIGVFVSFLILTYYSVIGGWILKYLVKYLTGGGSAIATDSENFFGSFVASPVEPVIWHLVFITVNFLIVLGGVEGGLEKASKFMMPTLFVLIMALVVRSLTLPNAQGGIDFMLKPDFSKINMKTIIDAMGQVFFSLSLGMGIMITYGSYMGDDSDLAKNALVIPALDTMCALMAGFAIMPAVFSFGFEPSAGPGLIFITLPAVFNSMPFGSLFGVLFFLLVLFAALTSSISLSESPVAYLIDEKGFSRKNAVIVVGVSAALIGVLASLSMGVFDTKFFGKNFFDLSGYIAESLLMPLAGLLMCVVLNYVFTTEKAIDEISDHGTLPFKSRKVWQFLIRYIAPVAIFIVWLNSSGIVDLVKKLF